MPYCTMCGAELAPEAKFCGSCGAAVEQGEPQQPQYQEPAPQQPQYQQAAPQQPQYQPQQAAPQQPQYQPQQAAPQQPQYQQAAPQQPQYQQAAPQQTQYQQAAPQQPQYQQAQPQYQQAQPQYQQAAPQQPVSKQKIDYLPNAANDKTTRFMWGGVAAALMAVALLFISRTSGYHLNSIWYGMSIASTGLSCIAMVSIFLSLRKGLAGQTVMPQLLNATAILNVVVTGISLLAAVLVLLGDSGTYKVIRTLSDLYEIGSLAYLVCFIIVAVKLLMAYEGNMKNLAIVMLVVPAIGLLMVLLESRTKAVTILFTVGIQGAYCYLYYLAHQIFTGKKLF